MHSRRRCSTDALEASAVSSLLQSLSIATGQSSDITDGWVFGYALDGQGGAQELAAWDESVPSGLKMQRQQSAEDSQEGVRDACEAKTIEPVGFWVHLNFKHVQNVKWIWKVVNAAGTSRPAEAIGSHEDMATLWLNRLAESSRVTWPRCEVSENYDSLFLSLRAAIASSDCYKGPDKPMRELEIRMCLSRNILITACLGKQAGEKQVLLGDIEKDLLKGRGAKTCGQVVATVAHSATQLSEDASHMADAQLHALRVQLQGVAASAGDFRPVVRRELQAIGRDLATVRYNTSRLLRYLAPQSQALRELVQVSAKSLKLGLFSRADHRRYRQAVEGLQRLDETLGETDDAAKVLQDEILSHVNWANSEVTYRLTVFMSVVSLLIAFNIVVNLFEVSERRCTFRTAATKNVE